jgi:enoyl-CoA hydratase
MGMARAKYHLLMCNRISGREAAEMGLVAKCVPHHELMDTANEIAVKLASGPQFALQATKAALNDWYQHNISIFEHSLYMEALSMTMADHEAGIEAFKARQEPAFRGNGTSDVY